MTAAIALHEYEPCSHPGRHGYTLPGDLEDWAFCDRCRLGPADPCHDIKQARWLDGELADLHPRTIDARLSEALREATVNKNTGGSTYRTRYPRSHSGDTIPEPGSYEWKGDPDADCYCLSLGRERHTVADPGCAFFIDRCPTCLRDRHDGPCWASDLADLAEQSATLYVVQASIQRRDAGGWFSRRALPTFFLNANTGGIVSLAHAAQIARAILDPWGEYGDDLELSVVSA